MDFPPQHCRGIAVHIDTAETPDCLSRFLPGIAVCPKAIEEKFCGKKGYHIARAAPPIEHIFSALYTVPDEIRQSYAKIKMLELLLLLSAHPAGGESPNGRPASPLRADLAKTVAGYLAENMKERITLERTAERFHVSATTIKTAFRSVFGVSFYAYVKARKMQSAADMLACTGKTVSDIAAEHGYDNPSKFATAFRAVKGISPTEYRLQSAKRHS